MKLSVVSTLYQSAPYVEEFHRRASAAAEQLVGQDYEIILVNDGSPDNSLEIAVNLTKSDPHLVVVDLSRNFGHHKALMTGLSYAKGERVFLIDSDLEEKPEWLIPFAAQMDQEACDVVYGVQKKRKGSFFERWSGEVFYWLFRRLTNLDLPKNILTVRLISRSYLKAFLFYQEREIFLGGLWHIVGFDQNPHLVEKAFKRATTYTIRHKISLFFSAIVSFSNYPLNLICYTGFLIFFLSSLSICYLLGSYLFFSRPLRGWTSLMASIWLLGGVIIIFVGVVGLYLSKIFSEVKRRPLTITRAIYQRGVLNV
ncbi:MAG: glycosyltransferase family 2 protein [Holosporales bacterium]|nr:glycosyltransferase family 2 protein [Holosporales bacterium]